MPQQAPYYVNWDGFTQKQFQQMQQDIRDGKLPVPDNPAYVGIFQVGDISVDIHVCAPNPVYDADGEPIYGKASEEAQIDFEACFAKKGDAEYDNFHAFSLPLKTVQSMSYATFQHAIEQDFLPTFIREEDQVNLADYAKTNTGYWPLRSDWDGFPKEAFDKLQEGIQQGKRAEDLFLGIPYVRIGDVELEFHLANNLMEPIDEKEQQDYRYRDAITSDAYYGSLKPDFWRNEHDENYTFADYVKDVQEGNAEVPFMPAIDFNLHDFSKLTYEQLQQKVVEACEKNQELHPYFYQPTGFFQKFEQTEEKLLQQKNQQDEAKKNPKLICDWSDFHVGALWGVLEDLNYGAHPFTLKGSGIDDLGFIQTPTTRIDFSVDDTGILCTPRDDSPAFVVPYDSLLYASDQMKTFQRFTETIVHNREELKRDMEQMQAMQADELQPKTEKESATLEARFQDYLIHKTKGEDYEQAFAELAKDVPFDWTNFTQGDYQRMERNLQQGKEGYIGNVSLGDVRFHFRSNEDCYLSSTMQFGRNYPNLGNVTDQVALPLNAIAFVTAHQAANYTAFQQEVQKEMLETTARENLEPYVLAPTGYLEQQAKKEQLDLTRVIREAIQPYMEKAKRGEIMPQSIQEALKTVTRELEQGKGR